MRMSQNSSVLKSWAIAGRRGVRVVAEDALGGVGGFDGRKKEGMAAIVACGIALDLVRRKEDLQG